MEGRRDGEEVGQEGEEEELGREEDLAEKGR